MRMKARHGFSTILMLTSLTTGVVNAQQTGATIETTITQEMAEIGCTLRLNGIIQRGDTQRLLEEVRRQEAEFRQIVAAYTCPSPRWQWECAEFPERFTEHFNFSYGSMRPYHPENFSLTPRLCLNSSGGSILEALDMAEAIHQLSQADASGLPTGIARGDVCESACAWVFLAGSWRRFFSFDSLMYDKISDAILHPSGRLGLHMPFIALQNNDLLGFEDAMRLQVIIAESIGRIVHAASQEFINVSFSLLSEVLQTPFNSMLRIETVADALEYNVEIVNSRPVGFESLIQFPSGQELVCGEPEMRNRCQNLLRSFNRRMIVSEQRPPNFSTFSADYGCGTEYFSLSDYAYHDQTGRQYMCGINLADAERIDRCRTEARAIDHYPNGINWEPEPVQLSWENCQGSVSLLIRPLESDAENAWSASDVRRERELRYRQVVESASFPQLARFHPDTPLSDTSGRDHNHWIHWENRYHALDNTNFNPFSYFATVASDQNLSRLNILIHHEMDQILSPGFRRHRNESYGAEMDAIITRFMAILYEVELKRYLCHDDVNCLTEVLERELSFWRSYAN
jgi:hypothetical protein